ncbi:MAG: energy transducer TonB [Chlorobi bacterium]|nr:energy transducer TonB [Chlorobiota bacterium]
MKRIYEDQHILVRIPWDSNTAKGFVGALALVGLLLLLTEMLPAPRTEPRAIYYDVLATVTFGAGDGSGLSKGNLALEGIRARSLRTSQPLADAERAASANSRSKHAKSRTSSDGGKFVPIAEREASRTLPRDSLASKERSTGSGTLTSGDRDGQLEGTGRGKTGSGPGTGQGYGDIEWGGGGSAVVVRKVVPKAPDGLLRSTIVKLRFVVSPDGDIIEIRPLIRGIPEAESAAIRALRQWRFRPLNNDTPVVGIITFRFDVN